MQKNREMIIELESKINNENLLLGRISKIKSDKVIFISSLMIQKLELLLEDQSLNVEQQLQYENDLKEIKLQFNSF